MINNLALRKTDDGAGGRRNCTPAYSNDFSPITLFTSATKPSESRKPIVAWNRSPKDVPFYAPALDEALQRLAKSTNLGFSHGGWTIMKGKIIHSNHRPRDRSPRTGTSWRGRLPQEPERWCGRRDSNPHSLLRSRFSYHFGFRRRLAGVRGLDYPFAVAFRP
jgi:hypothetical protein